MPKSVRTPTDEEYAAYDGMHCWQLWATTIHDWRCPGCGRTKREIMTWGKRGGANATNYGPVGWKCALHRHHDHGADHGYERRFPDAVLCNGCNSIDAKARRMVRAPEWFSFSPFEIAQFIHPAAPHTALKINPAALDQVYQRASSQVIR